MAKISFKKVDYSFIIIDYSIYIFFVCYIIYVDTKFFVFKILVSYILYLTLSWFKS